MLDQKSFHRTLKLQLERAYNHRIFLQKCPHRIGCAIECLPNRFNTGIMADGMYVYNTKKARRVDVYPNLIRRGLWSEEYNGYSAWLRYVE